MSAASSSARRGGKKKTPKQAPKKVQPKKVLPPGASVLSALAILPPDELCSGVQAVRQVHDKAYHRWMPHINLLFPWIEPSTFDEAVAQLTALLGTVRPFTLRCEHFQEFVFKVKPTYSSWLSYRPEVVPDAGTPATHGPFYSLLDLHRRLAAHYPGFDQHESCMGFRAHLTVAQLSGPSHQQVRDTIEAALRPIEWNVDRIFLLARDASGPFRAVASVPLGTALSAAPPPLSAGCRFVVADDAVQKIALSCGQWIHRMWQDPSRRASLPATRSALAHAISKFCVGRTPVVCIDDVVQSLLARGTIQLKATSQHLITYAESDSDAARRLTAPHSPAYADGEDDTLVVTFEHAVSRAQRWIANPNCKARPRTIDALKESLRPLIVQPYRIDPNVIIRLLEEHKAIDVLPSGKIKYD